MSTGIQIKQNISRPYKRGLYQEFILWVAMPHEEKIKLGIESQKDFAAYHNVNEGTLSEWKKRPDFEDKIDEIVAIWAREKTPAVVHSIYRSSLKGNAMSQMLWLQYFKRFNPKKDAEEAEKKVVLNVNDIRYAIEQLPEPIRTECYGYLRTIVEHLVAIRNSRDIEDDRWNERPAETIPDETDNDAQNIRYIEQPNAVAESDTPGVRRDMVRTVSKSHNQSTERWWEE